jgi:hypothetical protein
MLNGVNDFNGAGDAKSATLNLSEQSPAAFAFPTRRPAHASRTPMTGAASWLTDGRTISSPRYDGASVK